MTLGVRVASALCERLAMKEQEWVIPNVSETVSRDSSSTFGGLRMTGIRKVGTQNDTSGQMSHL